MTDAAAEAVLERIRAALSPGGGPATRATHPGPFAGYPDTPPPGDDALVSRFGQKLEALSGRMHRASDPLEAARIVSEVASRAQARRILSWDEAWLGCPGLHARLQAAGLEVSCLELPDDPLARGTRLLEAAQFLVGLTGARAALADTGTVVLASGPGCSRLASLLPPVHVAIVSQRTLYPSLPSCLAAHPDLVADSSNVVLVTGPSRTADIEMTLTHGVHGPREIHVIVMP